MGCCSPARCVLLDAVARAPRFSDAKPRWQSHDNTVKLWEIGYLREDAGTEAPGEGAAAASDDDSDDSDSEEKDARKGKKRKVPKQAKVNTVGKKGKPAKGGPRDPNFFKGLCE